MTDPPLVDSQVLADLREEFASTGDLDELARLIRNFLSGGAQQLAAVAAAVEASDAEEVRRTAHRLKGSSRTLGAARLGAVAAGIESAGAASDVAAAQRSLPELERVFALTRAELSSTADSISS